jgi:hypothetical protein
VPCPTLIPPAPVWVVRDRQKFGLLSAFAPTPCDAMLLKTGCTQPVAATQINLPEDIPICPSQAPNRSVGRTWRGRAGRIMHHGLGFSPAQRQPQAVEIDIDNGRGE